MEGFCEPLERNVGVQYKEGSGREEETPETVPLREGAGWRAAPRVEEEVVEEDCLWREGRRGEEQVECAGWGG